MDTLSGLNSIPFSLTYPAVLSLALGRQSRPGNTVPPDQVGPRTLLVVDEDDDRRAAIAEHLRHDGFLVEESPAIHDIYADVLTLAPDLVVLGVDASNTCWTDACRELRQMDPSFMMPIVLVGRGADEGTIIAGLEAGADDYVADSGRVDELRARIRAQLRHRRDREALRWAREQRSSFRAMALTDPLTRVGNRRHGNRALDEALGQQKEAVAIVLIDLDHFKEVNDTYGHEVGDVVLECVAGALERSVPSGALVSRWGGEEFAVILEGSGAFDAVKVAERCRAAVGALGPFGVDGPPGVTVSLGVALREPGQTISSGALMSRADTALYSSKRSGRNRVSFAQTEGPRWAAGGG